MEKLQDKTEELKKGL